MGYGLAGSVFHAPLVAAAADTTVAAIVTADEQRGRDAARRHPGAEILTSTDEVWARADQLDLVVVAAPNRAHVPLGLTALEAGLPVVIDKPVATSADGARLLADAGRAAGLPVVPFHNRRWDADVLTLQRLIGEGALGDVLRFESRFERWRPEPRAGSWRELGSPEDGGGVLLDLGIHLIDQALMLFGPVESVYAEVMRRRPGVVTDDDVFVALKHAGGVTSHLWAAHTAAQPGPRLRVLGSRAAYVKWGLDGQEQALRDGGDPAAAEWGREPRESWGLLGAGHDAAPVRSEPGCYPRFYERVAAAVRGDGPPPVSLDDAAAGLAIAGAAAESSRSGRVIRLADRS